MNERIRELADEARIKFSSHWAHEGVDTAVITRRDLKDFAELIVDEVYDYILNATFDDDEPWPDRKDVKKHFGVE